jgi:hypothetical protein
MKLIKFFEINKKDNNMICLENDDFEVLVDEEILDDFKLDEQVLILVIYEILSEIFFDDDFEVLVELVDDQKVEKI